MRRVRSLTRIGILPLIAAVVVPGAIVGGVAYARAGDTSGSMSLLPGGSAVADTGTSFTDGTAKVSFVLPGRPVGQSLYLGLEMRANGGSLYRAKARVFPDGAVSVDLGKVLNKGAEQYLGSKKVTTRVGTGTTTLTLEGNVTGNAVKVRTSTPGVVAPAWAVSFTDPAPITTKGSVRVWSYLSSRAKAPIGFQWKNFTTSSGTPTPSMPPTTTKPAATTTSPAAKPTTTKPTTTKPSTTTTTSAPPPATSGSPTMQKVLANSGADLDTNYSYPSNAVVVPAGGSIAAAVAKAPSGGTVVLRGGTYRQGDISVSKRLNIQAYPHEKPVLTGADVVSAWSASGNAWVTTNWVSKLPQNEYRAEEVTAGTAAGRVEQAYRNGKELIQVLNRSDLASGRFWMDPSTKKIWVADNPSGATMELSTRTRGMTINQGGGNGSKILGLRFTAYAAPHVDNSGGLYDGADNGVIENSQFDHSSGAGLKIAGTNMTVNRITASDNHAEGMQGNRNDGTVVQNSQFVRNNRDEFKVWLCGASCTVAGFKTAHTNGITVKDNAFVDNDANGFWCDLGCVNGVVTGNAITGSYDGIFYEVSTKGTISNNYVENSDKGIRISGSDHVTVTGNTLNNNNWQLTVYDDRRSSNTDSWSAALGLTWNATAITLQNNKITAGSRTTKLLEMNNLGQAPASSVFSTVSGNGNSGNQKMTWCPAANQCSTYATIADWKKASGKGF